MESTTCGMSPSPHDLLYASKPSAVRRTKTAHGGLSPATLRCCGDSLIIPEDGLAGLQQARKNAPDKGLDQQRRLELFEERDVHGGGIIVVNAHRQKSRGECESHGEQIGRASGRER